MSSEYILWRYQVRVLTGEFQKIILKHTIASTPRPYMFTIQDIIPSFPMLHNICCWHTRTI